MSPDVTASDESPTGAPHTAPMNPAPLVVFAVLVPLMFWAAYHYYHDRHRPEPLGGLLLCILLGVAAAWVSRGMYAGLELLGLRFDAYELAVDNLPGLFAYAVFGIGLTEELSKLLPFVAVVIWLRAFDEPLDGIVYASFIALGYSLVENLHYLQFVSPGEAFARGFAAPLVHIVFASMWAYPIAVARLNGDSLWRATVPWLAASTLLHGIYDFVAIGFAGPALIVTAGIVLALWVWRLVLLRRLAQPS